MADLIQLLRNRRNLAILTTVLIVVMLAILMSFDFGGDDSSPCSSQGYPGKCYSIGKNICKVIWPRFERDCSEELRKRDLGIDQPGRLMGPVVFACQATKYDNIFHYTRMKDGEEPCATHFAEIEKYKSMH